MAVSIGAYVMLWIGGVVSSAIWGEAPEGAAWAAPVFLYLASALVILAVGWRQRVVLLLVGAIGFAAEVVGESTGFPFGEYHYTDTLGPELFGVPIALVSAWIVITAFVVGVLIRIKLSRRWWVIAGPALMVLVDLALEPVATGPMDAWMWESTGAYYDVPVTNFLGWVAVSVPIFVLLAVTGYSERRGFIAAASVVSFFIALAVVHLIWGPLIVVSAAGVVLLAWRSLRSTRSKEAKLETTFAMRDRDHVNSAV